MTTPQTPGPGIAVEERIDTRPDRVLRPEPGDSPFGWARGLDDLQLAAADEEDGQTPTA